MLEKMLNLVVMSRRIAMRTSVMNRWRRNTFFFISPSDTSEIITSFPITFSAEPSIFNFIIPTISITFLLRSFRFRNVMENFNTVSYSEILIWDSIIYFK